MKMDEQMNDLFVVWKSVWSQTTLKDLFNWVQMLVHFKTFFSFNSNYLFVAESCYLSLSLFLQFHLHFCFTNVLYRESSNECIYIVVVVFIFCLTKHHCWYPPLSFHFIFPRKTDTHTTVAAAVAILWWWQQQWQDHKPIRFENDLKYIQ